MDMFKDSARHGNSCCNTPQLRIHPPIEEAGYTHFYPRPRSANPSMLTRLMRPFFVLLVSHPPLQIAIAQGTVPTFKFTVKQSWYTVFGNDPAQATTTTIPT